MLCPATLAIPKMTQHKSAVRKTKLSKPSQMAEALYKTRTKAFLNRNASSELPMKLTDRTPRRILKPKLPSRAAENVQVSYKRKCARNRMD